jgi:tellurite resistance protein
VATLVLAGRLLTIWMLEDSGSAQSHPGYYLPSVGAPLVASAEAATLGYRSLALVLFGFGVISWVLIGAVLLAQLVARPRLPNPLIPTMAILMAPPLVAGNAWFAIDGGRVDGIALALAGYALLMAIVQLGLVPLYRTVPFGPGWWSYSFPCAAMIGNAIAWLAAEHARQQNGWTYLLLAGLTAFIGYLATRTVIALAHRSFLPRPDLTAVPMGLPAGQHDRLVNMPGSSEPPC